MWYVWYVCDMSNITFQPATDAVSVQMWYCDIFFLMRILEKNVIITTKSRKRFRNTHITVSQYHICSRGRVGRDFVLQEVWYVLSHLALGWASCYHFLCLLSPYCLNPRIGNQMIPDHVNQVNTVNYMDIAGKKLVCFFCSTIRFVLCVCKKGLQLLRTLWIILCRIKGTKFYSGTVRIGKRCVNDITTAINKKWKGECQKSEAV